MLYTLGYASYTQSAFIEQLAALGVHTLVDVRESPRSRKPGFGGAALQRRLAEHGIDYVHLRSLGAPRPLRDALAASGDREAFLRDYAAHAAQQDEIERLAALAREGVVAAMCLETDPALCHRSVLAAIVKERWPGIEVVVR